jgi:hypothetical protein
MANQKRFTYVEPDLLPVLEELRKREPIFHTAEFGTTLADFERATDHHYWEVGASGRRYSRDFILRTLQQHPPIDATSANWRITEPGLRRLGPDTYLFTYTLYQEKRVTRRATIWQNAAEIWRILYHQGTLVPAEEDDISAP